MLVDKAARILLRGGEGSASTVQNDFCFYIKFLKFKLGADAVFHSFFVNFVAADNIKQCHTHGFYEDCFARGVTFQFFVIQHIGNL